MNMRFINSDVGGVPAYIPNRCCLGAELASLLGAGVSALGGLFSSGMSSAASERIARENRDWQEQMWNKNNAYNTPVEQRKRLELAGINPALAFQSGNTGVASSTPNAPNAPMPDFSPISSGFSAAASQLVQGSMVQSQANNLDADTELKRQQAMTQYSRDMATLQKTLADESLSKSQRYFLEEQLYQLKELFDVTKEKNYAELANIQSQSSLNDMMKLSKAFEMELANKRFYLDKQLNQAQISAIAQQIAESVAHVRQTDESLALNAKAIANDVVHAMNQDAAAFENIGISKEMIGSEKFRNYVSSVAAPIVGFAGGLVTARLKMPRSNPMGVPQYLRRVESWIPKFR